MQIVTYKDAVGYLESFIGKSIYRIDKEFLKHHDPLERTRVLLDLLGNPQNKFPSVLIGGTSGKGSTAYLISHILTTAGYKTGFTLSPHLEKVNERLQINCEPISDKRFVRLLKSIILPSIRQMSKMEICAPSYFEILVGMAFKYFVDQKVDIAVVEVGMGGEFDATNTLYPLVAVLTNVSLDHTNILGKTVQKIARTKAGIIKGKGERGKGKDRILFTPLRFTLHPIVVTGVKQPSVIKIVEAKCKEVGAKLLRLGKDLPAARLPAGQGRQGFDFKIKKENLEGSVFDLIFPHGREVKLNDLQLSLLGDYQVENASLAIETVLQLKKFGFSVTEDHIRNALKTAFFPGRFEILRFAPLAQDKMSSTLILDGAHNPTKMKEFLKNLKKLFPKERKIFIVGFKFDKDISKMLKEIARVADKIIITEFKGTTDTATHASLDAESIKHQVLNIKYKGEVIVEKDSKKAFVKALNYPITQLPNYPTIVVVTGSLYLVGEMRRVCRLP